MAITVTLPVAAPTGLSATLQDGGSLAPNTTYYYVVIAYDGDYISAFSDTKLGMHSPLSVESSFTTTTTDLSVLINWTNISGVQFNTPYYNILLTTTSGDYTDASGYTNVTEKIGTITDGVAGYTITALSTYTYMVHSANLVNNLNGGIDKDLGTLFVEFTGGSGYTLTSVYNAIVSAGFSDYVHWDGRDFYLKGWLYSSGTTTGYMQDFSKNIMFLHGGICNVNPNFYFKFGSWNSTYNVHVPTSSCNIDFQHGRHCLRSSVAGGVRMYGCMFTASEGIISTVSENLNRAYYDGAASAALISYIDEIKECITDLGFRSTASAAYDFRPCTGSNNWGKGPYFRMFCTNNVRWYYGTEASFYDSIFNVNNATNYSVAHYVPVAGTTFYTNVYNCYWPNATGGIPLASYLTTYGNVTSDSYTQINYSLNIKVIDTDGDPVSGVTVSLKDKDDNSIDWIEYSGYDKEVTGTVETTPRTTDADGLVNTYYIESYKINLNPDNTEAAAYCDNVIYNEKYPITITLSLAGYEDYEIILSEFLEETSLLIKYPVLGFIPITDGFKHITHKIINGIA